MLPLDLLIDRQRRIIHTAPPLRRLHRVHHADPELDATTGLRFHPVELLLSMLLTVAAAVAVGAPPVAVLAFEVVLNATAMFNHAAVHLPARLEPPLHRVVGTPATRRTHHSGRREETDSCCGFRLG